MCRQRKNCLRAANKPRFHTSRPMTPDTPKDAPETPANGAAWLSVSEAAALAGISSRGIQKRATRGQLKARKALRRGVEVWEIDGHELSANLGANREPNRREPGANPAPSHVQNGCEPGANLGANRCEPGANQPDEMTARLLAQLETENSFLRGVVEQLQRDGAETRAALRKSLDNAPRQLTSGTPGTTPEVLISSKNGTSGQSDVAAAKVPEMDAETSGTGLTYGDLADWLNRDLGE